MIDTETHLNELDEEDVVPSVVIGDLYKEVSVRLAKKESVDSNFLSRSVDSIVKSGALPSRKISEAFAKIATYRLLLILCEEL